MKPYVLIVDDVGTNLAIAEEQLKDDFDVCLSSSGEEALQWLNTLRFDAVLMDYEMPGLNGIQTVEEMNKLPGCNKIPVIFLSGAKAKEIMAQAQERGLANVVGFMGKPFDKSALTSLINNNIQNSPEPEPEPDMDI